MCLFAVAGFSVTLPATRIAGQELHPLLLGPGRGALAGLIAALILCFRRERWPAARELASLSVVALGVVIGFPLCTALALRHVPAYHAVVIIGITPLMTSIAAVLRSRERPSPAFWGWAVVGALSVFAFGIAGASDVQFASADALLLLAVLLVSLGYAEGGRLARTRSGLSVICWALTLSLPLSSAAAFFGALHSRPPSLPASLSFAWVSLISSLIAFACWYRGLALGGVARGSQVQLLQPILSLVWCALLLGEQITLGSVIAGTAVLLSAAASRLARA